MSLPGFATLTSTTSQQLTIDVRGRRSERRLGVLAVLAMAIAASSLTLPPQIAVLFLMIVTTIVIAGLWWHGWLGGARRLTGISWLSDGSWLLSDAGRSMPATLSADCRAGSHWLWLRWRVGTGVRGPQWRSMLLVQGDIDARDLRRLSVRLRLDSVSRQPTHARSAGT
jgi:hypothetical protein